MTTRYQDIIDYIEIKTDDLKSYTDYKKFIIFYEIVNKINNNILDLESKIDANSLSKLKLGNRIDEIDKLIKIKKDIFGNLKKSNNTNDRRLKANLIIHNDNDNSCKNVAQETFYKKK